MHTEVEEGGGGVLDVSDCFSGSHHHSGIEQMALSRWTAVLPDEELVRLASLSVQAIHLAENTTEQQSDPYLSLAAACNCELVIRRARVGMS
jgi:hypothetical protein